MGDHLVCGGDRGAGLGIGAVGEPGARPGPGHHQDPDVGLGQGAEGLGDEGDALLAGVRLPKDPDREDPRGAGPRCGGIRRCGPRSGPARRR